MFLPHWLTHLIWSCVVMVCIGGLIFGCKRPHSAAAYFLSALVVISIVVGLRILCYTIYRLLNSDHQQPPGDHHHQSTSHDGVEMQAHRFCSRRASPDTKFVALGGDGGDGDSSFLVLHSEFQGTHLWLLNCFLIFLLGLEVLLWFDFYFIQFKYYLYLWFIHIFYIRRRRLNVGQLLFLCL